VIALCTLWLVACAAPREGAAASSDAPLHGVELEVGEPPVARVAVDRAWAEPGGAGRGTGAEATLGGDLVVTGATVQWDLKQGKATFEGTVRAVRGPVELRCARLDVRWVDGRVLDATATGGVTVAREHRQFTSDRARYDAQEGRIDLEGSPVLRDGPNRLSGGQMTVFVDSERLECSACRLEVSPP
jgi:lipopolysaccharide transport protein LptA